MTIKNRLKLIILMVSYLMIIFGGGTAYFGFNLQSKMSHLSEWVEKRVSVINNIRDHMGYGGAIHHFKNYLIRKDEQYYQSFKEDVLSIHQDLEAYEGLVGVTQKELLTLQEIGKFISQYDEKIQYIHAEAKKNTNYDISEMDQLVKVNDAPILSSLDSLIEELYNQKNQETSLIYKQIQIFVLFMLISLPLGIFLLWSIMLKSIQHILRGLKTSCEATEHVMKGDYQYHIEEIEDNEFGQFHQNLNAMIDELKDLSESNKKEVWISEGANELSSVMRRESVVNILAHLSLQEIAKYTRSSVGVLYVLESDQCYHVEATYALSENFKINNVVKLGDGLVGQVAQTQREMILSDIPNDYIQIVSGIGHAKPKQLLIFPLVYDDSVVGVLEIGKFKPYTDVEVEYIKRTCAMMALEITLKKEFERTVELLEDANAKRVELEHQKNELKQNNQELVEQKEEIKKSQERLKAHHQELKVLNENLAEKTEKLESFNAEIEQYNRRLIEKSAELEKTSRYKSEFLANMSHELRTPLNSIIVLSNILVENKKKNLCEKEIDFAKTILSSGRDLLSLINDVLDIAKVEAGRYDVRVGQIDFHDLKSSLERLFSETANQKNIRFVVSLSNALNNIETFNSDDQKIKQILKNLVSNAFKFTETGEVMINIDSHKSGTIEFRVSDTGIGIPQDKLDSIFEAFVQIESGTNRSYNGSGLGLSISKNFATLLGGSLTVESEPGKGSQFLLTLPNIEETDIKSTQVSQEKNDAMRVPLKQSQNKSAMPRSRDKVLPLCVLIEPDPSQANGIKQAFENSKLPLDIVINPDNIEKLYQTKVIDMLIVEIGDRVDDYLKVFDALKKTEINKNSAIIIHTDKPIDIKQEFQIKANVEDIIIKSDCSLEKIIDTAKVYLLSSHTPRHNPYQVPLSYSFENMNKKSKILIVDDDVRNIFSLTSLLEEYNLDITYASNGLEAIQILEDKSQNIELVLMDIMMPKMDGLETIKHIRDKESKTSVTEYAIPIIAVTAKALPEDRELCIKAGANDYISKPVEPEQLLSLINIWLNKDSGNLQQVSNQ